MTSYRIGFGDHTLIKLFPDALYHPRELLNSNGDIIHPALYHLDHRLALGMAWHFLFMWLFFVNGMLYVLYTAISGEWRYLLPNRNTLREAAQVVLHDLKDLANNRCHAASLTEPNRSPTRR